MKSNPGYKFFHSNEIWIKNGLRICDKYRVFFIDEPLIIKYGGHQGQLSYSIESIENHRIKALEYLTLENLNRKNKRHAIQMLLSKLNIYLKGLVKRKKNDEIAVYKEKIKVLVLPEILELKFQFENGFVF